MEVEFYKLASSVKKTGDGALVFYLSNRVLGCKSLSYMNGDTLYPHYDSITGELTLFARSYYDYDDEGNTTAEWLEVWDKKYMYRYKKEWGRGVPFTTWSSEYSDLTGMYKSVRKTAWIPTCTCGIQEG